MYGFKIGVLKEERGEKGERTIFAKKEVTIFLKLMKHQVW